MKRKLYFYGAAVSAVIACVCAAPARQYASNAYTQWLSHNPAAGDASQANHVWAAIMLVFAVLAGALLFVGVRLRQNAGEMPG